MNRIIEQRLLKQYRKNDGNYRRLLQRVEAIEAEKHEHNNELKVLNTADCIVCRRI